MNDSKSVRKTKADWVGFERAVMNSQPDMRDFDSFEIQNLAEMFGILGLGGHRASTEGFMSWIDARGKQGYQKDMLRDGAGRKAVAYFRKHLGIPVSHSELAEAIGRTTHTIYDVLVSLDISGSWTGIVVYELDDEDKVGLGLKRRPAWYVAVTNKELKA